MDRQLREVLRRRVAAQHLIGVPAASAADYVRDSLAVQSQDMPLARFSVGLRTGLDDAAVSSELERGEVVRTHVLRPTWHYVHRDDVRWLLDLTGPKIISGTAARNRQLSIDAAVLEDSRQVLSSALRGKSLTRPELQDLLPTTAFHRRGDVVGHLLLMAEAEGLICSGVPRGGAHTYTVLEPGYGEHRPSDPADELVRRFVVGHGPTSIRDLQRWCNLTLTQIRHGLAAADLVRGEVAGVELWWADGPLPDEDLGTWLLPTFDETFLSHDAPRFPRLPGHRLAEQHLNPAEAGGGIVIVDGHDVATFKRTKVGKGIRVALALAPGVSATRASRAEAAARRLGEFVGSPVAVERA